MIRIRPLLAASVAALAFPLAAHADDQSSAHRDSHDHPQGEIVVAAHPPVDFGLLASATTLEGDTLIAQTRGQIGETLARLPGVSATSFSPGASRPVLRGFDGDRIRVLVDGIGTVDASSVSADHAVVFDPLSTDHIDVLHGPSVLLFGGQAIGGAVNALDKRIPRRIPATITGTAIGGYGSAADERSVGGAIDVPLGDRFAVHIDASWRKSDDLRVGGFVNSPSLRDDLLADAAAHRAEGEAEEAADLEETAALSGRLPNSGARTSTLGAGAAFIDAGGNIGVSVQRFDSRYGVPLRPGAGHHHEGEEGTPAEEEDHAGEAVSIDLVQTRVDLRAGINLSGPFRSFQVRGAHGDYRHTEFEGQEIGTRFFGKGLEIRGDLIQSELGGWRGRSGIQYATRTLEAVGAEAFVPGYEVGRVGVFTLQSLALGAGFETELSGRYERASVRSAAAGFDRTFDLWSGGAGLSFAPAERWKIGVNYIRGARSPAPEELLSDGVHVATQSYELGNTAFGVETSDSFEGYIRRDGDRISASITAYITDFNRFIAALPNGDEVDEVPVFAYTQLPARFQGFEASARLVPVRWGTGAVRVDLSADYTHARLKGVGPAPRIPPLRLRGGLEVEQGGLRLRGEVEWNERQDRVAAYESVVPGFTLVNLGADWHPFGEDGSVTLIASIDNLLDADARGAASFTRDFVPLAGRDARITAVLRF